MMKLNGLHLLLTYQCTFECDHCFAWGSPWQTGTMTIEIIRMILAQAKDTGSVEWIYFEGGEPFLYYPLMVAGIEASIQSGFNVGVVTNGYWANSEEDAFLWLSPLAGKVHDLSISSDLFHYDEKISRQSQNITNAAQKLEIPTGVICIEPLEEKAVSSLGQIPEEPSSIMFRGRAVEKLAGKASPRPSTSFKKCPHENLTDPGRVHIDPLGYVHICQGISIGNIFTSSISEICRDFQPSKHPIIGPLIFGGPLSLANQFSLPVDSEYADACHLCYVLRKQIRSLFPDILAPDQMYGVYSN